MEDELGKNFWLKTVGVVIGLGILGILSFFIFPGLIARFGAIAALVIIFGIFFAIAYRSDKKQQRRWDEEEAEADKAERAAKTSS